MRRVPVFILRAAMAIALSVSFVACGGDAEVEPSSEAAAPEEGASEAETEEESSGESGDVAFCEAANVLEQAEGQLTEEILEAGVDRAANKKAFQRFVNENEEELDALVESAPAEIKDAVAGYVEYYRSAATGERGDVETENEQSKQQAKVVGYFHKNC